MVIRGFVEFLSRISCSGLPWQNIIGANFCISFKHLVVFIDKTGANKRWF